ncbi:MAG TPA: hypothetical protein VNL77_10450 [Roseiflexaceae bacterium]|nr:hypothetical protein [Roseiflexaceae bacterium]
MTTDTRLHPDDTLRRDVVPRRLVLGLLGPPVVWAVHFLAIYGVVALTCWAGLSRWTLLGLAGQAAVVLAATLVALALIGWAGWTAYGAWSAARADEEAPGWQAYAGRAGALLSGLFALAVVLETVPAFVLPTCG